MGTEFSASNVIFRKKIEVDDFEIDLEDLNECVLVDLKYLSPTAAQSIMTQRGYDFNKPASKKTIAAGKEMAKRSLRGWNLTWGQFRRMAFFEFKKGGKNPKDSDVIPFIPQYINIVLTAAEEFRTQVVIASQEKSNFRAIGEAKN